MIELLEPRKLLSVVINGTSGDDTIELLQRPQDAYIAVWINHPDTAQPDFLIMAGTPLTVFGNGGSDRLIFDNLINVPVVTNLDGEIDGADPAQDITVAVGTVVFNDAPVTATVSTVKTPSVSNNRHSDHWRIGHAFGNSHASKLTLQQIGYVASSRGPG